MAPVKNPASQAAGRVNFLRGVVLRATREGIWGYIKSPAQAQITRPCSGLFRATRVLTGDAPSSATKSLSAQGAAAKHAPAAPAAPPYSVKHEPLITPRKRARTGRKRGRKRKPGRRPAKKRGGWRTTSHLTHADYRLAVHRAHVIEKAGYPFTIFATVRPQEGSPDNAAKQRIGLQLARLGQALERRGQPYVGMVAFEKRPGGLLHGHALLFVLPENFDVVRRWADRFDETPQPRDEGADSVPKHARPAVETDVLYALKQHRWAGAREAARKFYQKGALITGARLSFTRAALAVISKAEGKAAPQAAAAAPIVIEASPRSTYAPPPKASPAPAPAAPIAFATSPASTAPPQLCFAFDDAPSRPRRGNLSARRRLPASSIRSCRSTRRRRRSFSL